MSVASLLLDVLGPVVVLCALGAAIGPRLSIDKGSLSRLAYWVLGPAFVFDLFVTTDLAGPTVARLAISGLAGMAAAALAVLGAGRVTGIGGRPLKAMVMTGAYGNVGNAGLAISAFALGDDALATAGVVMLTINISGIMLGVGLASDGVSPTRAVGRALASPMPVAGAVALALNLADLEVPLVIGRSAGLLSGAMIPVMLFTLGIQLVSGGAFRVGPAIGIATGAKLIVAPVVSVAVAVALDVTGDDLAVLAIQSAMPPAVFSVLVALEFDLEPEQVTDNVVVTTMAALLTVPVVLAVVT